MKHLMNTNH